MEVTLDPKESSIHAATAGTSKRPRRESVDAIAGPTPYFANTSSAKTPRTTVPSATPNPLSDILPLGGSLLYNSATSGRQHVVPNPLPTTPLVVAATHGPQTASGLSSSQMGMTELAAVKNQIYRGPLPIVVPFVPAPKISEEALKEMSKKRSEQSRAVAARIIAQTRGPRPKPRPVRKAKLVPPPPLSLFSIEELKALSSDRARQSREIAARIIAEDIARKNPNRISHRFPCPAKKMGVGHNKHTAFFDIPPESNHGMPLECSHALCRKGRLKFVYCKYCNQPVSRMKFEERHSHPEHLLLNFADNGDDDDEGDGNGAGKELLDADPANTDPCQNQKTKEAQDGIKLQNINEGTTTAIDHIEAL